MVVCGKIPILPVNLASVAVHKTFTSSFYSGKERKGGIVSDSTTRKMLGAGEISVNSVLPDLGIPLQATDESVKRRLPLLASLRSRKMEGALLPEAPYLRNDGADLGSHSLHKEQSRGPDDVVRTAGVPRRYYRNSCGHLDSRVWLV